MLFSICLMRISSINNASGIELEKQENDTGLDSFLGPYKNSKCEHKLFGLSQSLIITSLPLMIFSMSNTSLTI